MEVQAQKFEVENLDLVVNSLEVRLNGNAGHIKIDGRAMCGVQKLTVECEFGKHPVVTMAFIPTQKKEDEVHALHE